MTSGQCLHEMQPLTVRTAGQDGDTSRFKEELPAGRDTEPQRADAAGWNGTLVKFDAGLLMGGR